MPTIAELMQSLPEAGAEADRLPEPLAAASIRPVPVGRLRRIGLLGTLQAKIAAASATSAAETSLTFVAYFAAAALALEDLAPAINSSAWSWWCSRFWRRCW